MKVVFATFMLNAHDARGHHTKSDETLIFLPPRLNLRPDEADSLVVRILIFIAIMYARISIKWPGSLILFTSL